MKVSKKIRKNVAAEPESRKWLWLQLGVGVFLTIAVAIMYIFDANENQVASKTQSEHAGHHGGSNNDGARGSVTNGGPTGGNTPPPPGPPPQGMGLVAGGAFWVGRDTRDMPHAAPAPLGTPDGLFVAT